MSVRGTGLKSGFTNNILENKTDLSKAVSSSLVNSSSDWFHLLSTCSLLQTSAEKHKPGVKETKSKLHAPSARVQNDLQLTKNNTTMNMVGKQQQWHLTHPWLLFNLSFD